VGGKGHSVAHNLIEILNFILHNHNLPEPLTTILTAVDIHKGFNKTYHEKTLTPLSDFQTPGWLLKIVCSYLSNHTLSIRYKGSTCENRRMPSGPGAGTILGLKLFLVMFSQAGPQTAIGATITQHILRRKLLDMCKVKWIDDLTICTALDLKETLVPEDREVPRPVPYHSSTGHMLMPASNALQKELDLLQQYTLDNKMALNTKKLKAMICNSRSKWDVMPELSIVPGKNIELVEEIKIVGFMLRSDLKTSSNTKYLVKKAYARMWIVRRLKSLGASVQDLLDVLQKQVLSVLYLGAPAWFPLVTQTEKNYLNRVLRCGLRIVYGLQNRNFECSLSKQNMKYVTQQLKTMKTRPLIIKNI
jgi:hypothetical protein